MFIRMQVIYIDAYLRRKTQLRPCDEFYLLGDFITGNGWVLTGITHTIQLIWCQVGDR